MCNFCLKSTQLKWQTKAGYVMNVYRNKFKLGGFINMDETPPAWLPYGLVLRNKNMEYILERQN